MASSLPTKNLKRKREPTTEEYGMLVKGRRYCFGNPSKRLFYCMPCDEWMLSRAYAPHKKGTAHAIIALQRWNVIGKAVHREVVRQFSDYTYGLSERRPGDSVVVSVKNPYGKTIHIVA